MATVVVGLSGGVDSSVAAALLKEQGHNVIGLFMKNWHDEAVTISNECPWEEDSNDALLVANHLGIPFQTIDLSEEYKERIVDYMFTEYEAGRTPNPDVLCNREIKFDVFLKAALAIGADYVATGHYCRKSSLINKEGKEIHQLLAGKDPNKDQSYFLCQLNQEQLSRAIFPIGEMLKPEVRVEAERFGLHTFNKKDSQGLCFVGKIKLPDFLKQKLQAKTGKVYEFEPNYKGFEKSEELETLAENYEFDSQFGKELGEHQGAHFYTIGQRKGLGIGGTELPLFVLGTNTKKNEIYVGQGESHPGLMKKALRISKSDIHWVRPDLSINVGEEKTFSIRIRYRQPLQHGTLINKKDAYYILFDKAQRGVTPGQFAAWYDGEELIGSGVIA